MTKKAQISAPENCKSRRRILKPVIEKKRRDRINQSLAELRRLLLNHTEDPRLQNAKIEKAEILDLTVEYLRTWTDGAKKSNDSAESHKTARGPLANLSSAPAVFTHESAGFQQCIAQLTSYMHKMPPTQRTSLMEGLMQHSKTPRPKPGSSQKMADTDVADTSSADSICISERRKDESVKMLPPSHSPFQPHSCSTPCHDFLSPPPSPWFSPSFSTYTFPSFASHFSLPPSLSPPSSNTSFIGFSPTVPHTGPSAFCFPPLTTPRSSPHLTRRQASSPSSSAMWRPWSRD